MLACGLGVGHVQSATAQTTGGLESDFAARVTAERRAVGLGELPSQEDLVAVARGHSAAMAAANRLYHNTLLGQQVQGWLLVGENVGTGASVDQVHAALMASPPHRADIVDARFTGIGVGVVQSGATLWVTQVFRRSSGAVAAAATPPSPPPPPAADLPATAPPPAAARPATSPRPVRRAAAEPATAAPTTVPATTSTSAAPVTSTTTPAVTVAPAAGLDHARLAATSVPVGPRPGVVEAGLVAAFLLWVVAAGAAKVGLGGHLHATGP